MGMAQGHANQTDVLVDHCLGFLGAAVLSDVDSRSWAALFQCYAAVQTQFWSALRPRIHAMATKIAVAWPQTAREFDTSRPWLRSLTPSSEKPPARGRRARALGGERRGRAVPVAATRVRHGHRVHRAELRRPRRGPGCARLP